MLKPSNVTRHIPQGRSSVDDKIEASLVRRRRDDKLGVRDLVVIATTNNSVTVDDYAGRSG